ncbi:LysM peptidoglycan-binding domain-containing protein [Aerococcaceae bacterium NML191292]|nr:LysM peptidoglycan-binding domain-containing protein [Aerococcaceae bacterium NML191292]
MKILKKSKGKWLAVSVATTTLLMLGGGLTGKVSAEESKQHSLTEVAFHAETTDELVEMPSVDLEAEKTRALQQIGDTWEQNTIEEVTTEIERQKTLQSPVYIVQWGDTLSQLATASQTTVADLAMRNQIANPDLIYVGDYLEGILSTTNVAPSEVASPAPVWTAKKVADIRAEMQRQASVETEDYQIQWGDTLNGISLASGISVAELVATNRIVNPDLIYAGDFLKGLLKPFKEGLSKPIIEGNMVQPQAKYPSLDLRVEPAPSPKVGTEQPVPPVQEVGSSRSDSETVRDIVPPTIELPKKLEEVPTSEVVPPVADTPIEPKDTLDTGATTEVPTEPKQTEPEVVPPVVDTPPTPQETPDTGATTEVPTEPKETEPEVVPPVVEAPPTPQETPDTGATTEVPTEPKQTAPEVVPPVADTPTEPKDTPDTGATTEVPTEPKETEPEVAPPVADTPTEPKETPDTGATTEVPTEPKETEPEVVPPVADTPTEPKKEEVQPPVNPQVERPQLILQHHVLNPMHKSATLHYTLADSDRLFLRGMARLMNGQQVVQEVALSSELQATFTHLAYEVPYHVETILTYRMNNEEVSDTIAPSPQDSFMLALKKIELKHIQAINIQPIDNTMMSSLTGNAISNQTHIARIKLVGLNDILAPISQVITETINHQAVYRITMTLPELVQYDETNQQYSNDYVAYFNMDGTPVSLPTAAIDYTALPGYDATRNIAYHNVEKLLPFYNRELIVQYGNRVNATHELATKRIKAVLPMVEDKISVSILADKMSTNQLLVHYEDGTIAKFPLVFSQDFADGLIAEYTLDGTDLIYTPTQWQTDYSNVLSEVVKTLQGIDYYSSAIWHALGERGEVSELNMDQLYLKASFQAIQAQLPTILTNVLSNSVLTTSTEGLAEYILHNKEKLLLGLAYINKWYDVNFNAMNLKNSLLYRQEFFGKPVNQLEWLIGIGGRTYEGLRPNETPETYQQILAQQTGKQTLVAFLSSLRAQFVPQLSDNEWFKQATKAFIAEVPPQTANVEVNLYEKLSRRHFVNTLLPLLSLSEESLYIIPAMSTVSFGDFATYVDTRLKHSNPTAYQKAIADFKKIVLTEAENQTAYFDMWYRVALPKVKDKLPTYAIPVWDAFGQHITNRWSPRQGDDTTIAVREFFGPSGHWHAPSVAGAFSNGETIWFITDRLMRQTGSAGGSVFTHEVTHVLEDDIYLGGHGRREGIGQESYAEGLLQSVRDRTRFAMSMNFYTKMTESQHQELPYFNKSPERFQTAADLQQYMRGLLDVMYVLDYAEAMAIAKLPQYLQRQVLQRMTGLQDRDTQHHTDYIREFTSQEWRAIPFKTIDDFIENHAVVTRHHYQGGVITGGQHAGRNTYTGVPLFSPMYGLLQNDNGASGGYTFRRTAFELLAHKGYEAGMIPYISDQFAHQARTEGKELSDTFIVTQILGDEFASLTDFKKAMFRERIEKLAQLTPITITTVQNKREHLANFDKIQSLMDRAVRLDAAEKHRTGEEPSGAVHFLKERILAEYLRITDEFRTSIFGESGE